MKESMMSEHPTIEEQIEFGLGTIDPDRKIEIPLKDLLFTYLAIGEWIRFFHQPMHYPTLKNVQDFLGNKDKGALHILWEIYYGKLYEVWPEDIRNKFQEGDFERPSPAYYERPEE